MTRLSTALLLLATLALSATAGAEGPSDVAARVTHYDLQAQIQPATKQLRVRATLTVQAVAEPLASLRLFLHRELLVETAAVDGRPVTFRRAQDRTPDAPRFSPTAEPVDLALSPPLAAGQTARVELAYAGPISTTVNGVNLISERLTELALYSAWYPLLPGDGSFTYDLSVTLPAGQTCVSDGDLIGRRAQGDDVVCHTRRVSRASDVPLIASNVLKSRRVEAAGFQAEILFDRLAEADAEGLARVATDGYAHMVARYGPPAAAGHLVLVVSPRDGWGYSRVPLSVVPEAYALEALTRPDGRLEVLHGNLHEVGHFWWQSADSTTSDDWINESLAEFAALDACEHLFGAEPVAAVRRSYEKDVREIAEPTAIVATRRTDPNGYVLFYEKGALLWERLREMLGEETLFGVLRRLHATYRGTRALTTPLLVEAFSKETAGRTDAVFTEWLRGTTLPASPAPLPSPAVKRGR